MIARATLILLALSSTRAIAQNSRPQDADLGPYVQRFAAEVGLRSLTKGLIGGEAEIRVWTGFGVTGVTLHRIVRVDGHWTAVRSVPIDHPESLKSVALPDSIDWAGRWTSERSRVFFDLAPRESRGVGYVPRNDGYAVVIEAAEGPRYHIVGWSEPPSGCTPRDHEFVRILAALLPAELDWHCQTN